MVDALAGTAYVCRREQPDRSRVAHRVLVLVIVLLSVTLLVQLAWHLVIGPRLTIRTITVIGDLSGAEEALLAAAGLRPGMTWFEVHEQTAATLIARDPRVRSAVVERVFPDSLRVYLIARTPLALSLADTPEGAVALLFDEEGVVFEVGAGARFSGLPVVSGLRFAVVEPGLRLPPLVVRFLKELHALKTDAPELYSLFSEYRVVRTNEHAYEVIVYPMHFPVPVRVSTRISPQMVQYVMMVLDTLKREGRLAELAEVDFRTGEAVLRFRSTEAAHG